MSEALVPRVIHADDSLLVAVKPAGLPAVPGRPASLQDCMVSRLALRWPGVRVVHRLDMATSGLMVFALDAATQVALSRAFERREVVKRYEAWVGGPWPHGSEGSIDFPLAPDWPRRPRQKVCADSGRPALTHWRTFAGGEPPCQHATRLLLLPITGRTHQLRVHLAALGHPIVGDTLYAQDEALPGAGSRLMLHASGLEFTHPASGEALHFADPPPF